MFRDVTNTKAPSAKYEHFKEAERVLASTEQSHKVVCVFARVRAGEISGEDNSIVPPRNVSRRGLAHLLLAQSVMG